MKKTANQNFFDLLKVEGLSSEELKQMAFKSGFIKRIPKKIEPVEFLVLMCLESQKGSPSYNDLASRHENMHNIDASKQAFCKKVNNLCVDFFQAVLVHLISSKIKASEINIGHNFFGYKRILIQDSTIIKLPESLFRIFSGVSNAHKKVCNARIQSVYDLVSGTFISFSIDSYSKNDISVASKLELRKGDLVLRDRGYYSAHEIKRHVNEQADFIYRFKKTVILHPTTGKEINLLKLLKSKGNIDMEVCLNNDKRTKVRLVAVAVSEEVANKRRMRAKKETRGHNPSEELLNLMSWTIFITNIHKEQADFKKIALIYGIRWRIEIIFKSWKSHMHFSKLHKVSKNQLYTLFIARFIMITICTVYIYKECYCKIFNKFKIHLSLLKLIKYLMSNPEKIAEILRIINQKYSNRTTHIDKVLLKYCSYDKRKRLNFNQIIMSTLY